VLPNFFIVGAPRAGTTSLYDYLDRTKDVFMSLAKEPHYFSSIEPSSIHPRVIRDKKKYLALFKKANNAKAIGEASTSYLWDPESAKLIHNTVPHAKIIIMLRDPIERAFSHYIFRLSSGKTYSFTEAIKEAMEPKNDYYSTIIVNGSYYYNQVKRYLDKFGSNNVKVIIFEEFIKEPRKIVKEVLEFLEVKSEVPIEVDLPHNVLAEPRGRIVRTVLQNKTIKKFVKQKIPGHKIQFVVKKVLSKKITKPKIPQQDRIFLENIYKEEVQKLQTLLKRKLPWFLVHG